jgi:hypothetical protein
VLLEPLAQRVAVIEDPDAVQDVLDAAQLTVRVVGLQYERLWVAVTRGLHLQHAEPP